MMFPKFFTIVLLHHVILFGSFTLFGTSKTLHHQNATKNCEAEEIIPKKRINQDSSTDVFSGEYLVGGWTNPFEKYARQNGNLPQIGVKIKKFWNHHLGPRYILEPNCFSWVLHPPCPINWCVHPGKILPNWQFFIGMFESTSLDLPKSSLSQNKTGSMVLLQSSKKKADVHY